MPSTFISIIQQKTSTKINRGVDIVSIYNSIITTRWNVKSLGKKRRTREAEQVCRIMELSVYYVRGEFFVIYCNACVCELNSLYINVVSRVGYLYLENKSIIQKQWGDRSDKDSARGWWGMIRIIVHLVSMGNYWRYQQDFGNSYRNE